MFGLQKKIKPLACFSCFFVPGMFFWSIGWLFDDNASVSFDKLDFEVYFSWIVKPVIHDGGNHINILEGFRNTPPDKLQRRIITVEN